MNEVNNYILTDRGAQLLAKVTAESDTLNITRMVLGDGETDAAENYKAATTLNNEKYSMLITKKTQTGNACILEAGVMSEAIESGFFPYELGLYAMDGEEEILFSVTYTANPQYIPGKNDGIAIENDFIYTLAISSNAKINVTFPVTQEELIKLVQDSAANAVKANAQTEKAATSANNAASRANAEAKNAAEAAAKAENSATDAKTTAAAIAKETAADVTEAQNQASAAASSAQTAQEAKATAEELYRRFCVDIVGPPASAMNEADLFVAPGAAAMAAMER